MTIRDKFYVRNKESGVLMGGPYDSHDEAVEAAQEALQLPPEHPWEVWRDGTKRYHTLTNLADRMRQLQAELGDKFYEFASLCYAEAKYQTMRDGCQMTLEEDGSNEEIMEPANVAWGVLDNEHDDQNNYIGDLRDAYVKLGYLPVDVNDPRR